MGQTPVPGDRDTLVDSVDEVAGMLLALPLRTVQQGFPLLDTEKHDGYYIIVSGTAAEFAISRDGEPIADRIELGPKDVIGLGQHTRVEALTDLTVAVVDISTLADATPRLRNKVSAFLLDAARKRSTDTRNRLVERDATITEQTSAIEVLDGQMDSLRLEFDAQLSAKQSQIEDKIIDNTRLARRTKTLAKELENKSKECLSAATILTLYKEEIDETEETLQARTNELNELRDELAKLSGLAPVLERMISSDNKDWVSLAQKGLTLLYTQGKGRKH